MPVASAWRWWGRWWRRREMVTFKGRKDMQLVSPGAGHARWLWGGRRVGSEMTRPASCRRSGRVRSREGVSQFHFPKLWCEAFEARSNGDGDEERRPYDSINRPLSSPHCRIVSPPATSRHRPPPQWSPSSEFPPAASRRMSHPADCLPLPPPAATPATTSSRSRSSTPTTTSGAAPPSPVSTARRPFGTRRSGRATRRASPRRKSTRGARRC